MNLEPMKKAIIVFICVLISGSAAFAQFGINTDGSDPNNSAMLDVKSSVKGVLIPRMTIAERNAIPNPANGLMVYCTDCGLDGSLSIYSNTSWKTFAPCNNTPPTAGTHIPANSSIIWNWNSIADALGYRWNTTNNYSTATDVGLATSYTQTNLLCGTPYTLYVWAYNSCGVSPSAVLTQSTTGTITPPTSGTHVPACTSIIWNWNPVAGATGYKWSTVNDYQNAIPMGTATSKTENGLVYNNAYTRYVWAFNSCGVSAPTILTGSTLPGPNTPVAATHTSTYTTITWKWYKVSPGLDVHYKWNTTNDYSTAIDLLHDTTYTETGLTCNNSYTRYVWCYNLCGPSVVATLTQSTAACFVCGTSITVNHVTTGGVAPVNKTVTYGTVTNVPGVETKCWITSNLGSDHQATSATDATEPSAGWYWQFNRKQGYKHDGSTRTPNSTWITDINENLDWQPANDPCALELGNGWHLPTSAEWTAVITAGSGWQTYTQAWASPLKMHCAGRIVASTGGIGQRGSYGFYWDSNQNATINNYGNYMYFLSTACMVNENFLKAYGFTLRCIRD